MSDIRAVDRVRGSVHSLEELSTLQGDDCNVLLVSSRTMHLLANFALEEVNFPARYATSYSIAGKYHPVDQADVVDFDLFLDVARKFKLEVVDVTCDITQALAGIQSAILTAGSNACACGTVGETLEAGSGTPQGTPPEGFFEPDPAVTDRLCKAANVIHASLTNVIVELTESPVEGFLQLGFGIVTGLVSAVIAAAFIPVAGILVVGVAGAVIGITLAILAGGVDLGDLLAGLDDFIDDLICALVEAPSAEAARFAYKQVLLDGGLTSVNAAVAGALLTNNLLDLLWFATSDSEAFLATYVPPNDCSGCGTNYKIDTYGSGTDLDVTWVFDRIDTFEGSPVDVWLATSANDPTRNAHWIRTRAYSPVDDLNNPVCSKYVKIVFSASYDAGIPSGGDKWGYTVCSGSPVTGQAPLDTNLDRWYWASGLNNPFTAEVWINEVDGTPI